MFYFILELIFFLALAIMALLMLWRLPLVDGFEEEKPSRGTVTAWGKAHWHWVDRVDKKVAFYLAKTLRRLKVWTMKFDAAIARSIERVGSRTNGNGGSEGQHVIKTLQDERRRALDSGNEKDQSSDE